MHMEVFPITSQQGFRAAYILWCVRVFPVEALSHDKVFSSSADNTLGILEVETRWFTLLITSSKKKQIRSDNTVSEITRAGFR